MKVVSTIEDSLKEIQVLEAMTPDQLEFLAGCTKHVHFKKGDYLTRERSEATEFFAIRDGAVALEMGVGNRTFIFHTVGKGRIVGWSWLIPPFRSQFDARALTDIAAIRFDAVCVRQKCDKDASFGYEIMKRFSQVMAERLIATQMTLVDIYR
ncbi:MAG: cyclic nucleotide-binding domain-containing protein [Rhodothermales bacterium]|nr:cyclic nucleotide-binding domain-containing protein [Rhodothermales bacterium]